MQHFADRLAAAICGKGNAVCVGLDPRWESLPIEFQRRHGAASLASIAAAYEEFCSRVLDIVAPLVPVVKPQSAFFEACGPEGMAVLQRLLRKARDLNLVTILDGKRNDIASTASAYADAAFGGTRLAGQTFPVWDADALTINPYLGRDAVEPFLESARRVAAGLFVLVRTSNPGAGQFQDLLVSSGTMPPRPLYQHVGEAVAAWSRENLGVCGLGDVGAVVGATYPAELTMLRKLLPEVIFLVPGFGAQGGKAADVAPAFRPDGLGAIVNSSRGILFPFKPDEPRWQERIEEAARATIAALTSSCREQRTVYNVARRAVAEEIAGMPAAGHRDIHRIGGASIEDLRLKTKETKLNPPGISVLKTATPGKAAAEMRAAYPDAASLHEAAKTVGSSTIEDIRSVGFDVIPMPSRRLPNHCRLIHPKGIAGFTDENLARLTQVFTNTTGH